MHRVDRVDRVTWFIGFVGFRVYRVWRRPCATPRVLGGEGSLGLTLTLNSPKTQQKERLEQRAVPSARCLCSKLHASIRPGSSTLESY